MVSVVWSLCAAWEDEGVCVWAGVWGLAGILVVRSAPHPPLTYPPPSTHPGVHLWHARRDAWTALSPSRAAASGDEGGAAAAAPPRRPRAPVIEPDAVYEDLLASTTPFPRPIPLPEMVDFLVDTWIEDGLY